MRVINILVFVGGFGLARATLLFAPIILANILPIADYGRLELAHSYAAVTAVLVGFGLPSTVPLVLLRKEVSARWDTLLLICISVAVGSLLVAIVAFFVTGWLFDILTLTPLIVSVLILQQLWATTLKSKGAGTRSVFVEAGFWVAALCGAILIYELRAPQGTVSLALFAYFCFLTTLAVQCYIKHSATFGHSDLLANIRLGAPLMATVALSMLTASAGRLILGSITDVATVGIYAVLYRSTMLPLIGHQILTIALFRRLFTWDNDVLKRNVAILPACVTFGVIVFWLLEDRFGFLLGQRFVNAFADHRIEGIVILSQTILWSAVAVNDLLVTRLQMAGHVARRMIFILIISLPCLAIFTASTASPGVLRAFVFGYSTVIFVYYIIQSAVIARHGHRFFLLWSVATAGFLISIGVMLTVEWSLV